MPKSSMGQEPRIGTGRPRLVGVCKSSPPQGRVGTNRRRTTRPDRRHLVCIRMPHQRTGLAQPPSTVPDAPTDKQSQNFQPPTPPAPNRLPWAPPLRHGCRNLPSLRDRPLRQEPRVGTDRFWQPPAAGPVVDAGLSNGDNGLPMVTLAERISEPELRRSRRLPGSPCTLAVQDAIAVNSLHRDNFTRFCPQGSTAIPACEMKYPGDAAHSRSFGAGFRGVDASSGVGLSPNALNINGANRYQFVMNNPTSATDPSGATIWFPGMPFSLPQTRPWPLEAWQGPPHSLPCKGGVCRYYVNTHYSQDLGVIDTTGNHPSANTWALYAENAMTVVAGYSELAADLDLVQSNTILTLAQYAYDANVSFIKTRVYTYACGTNYLESEWQSATTKDAHFIFTEHFVPGEANQNIVFPGSDSAIEGALSAWDQAAIEALFHSLGGD